MPRGDGKTVYCYGYSAANSFWNRIRYNKISCQQKIDFVREGLYTCYKIYGGGGGGYVQVVKTSGGYVHKFNGGDYVHLYKNEQGYCHTLFYS